MTVRTSVFFRTRCCILTAELHSTRFRAKLRHRPCGILEGRSIVQFSECIAGPVRAIAFGGL